MVWAIYNCMCHINRKAYRPPSPHTVIRITLLGYMGAAMLLAGMVAANITSPVFDRVLTQHMGLAVRTMCPIIAAAWLSLIWAGKKVLLPFP